MATRRLSWQAGVAITAILAGTSARACDYFVPSTIEERIKYGEKLAESTALHFIGQFLRIDANDNARYKRCATVRQLNVIPDENGHVIGRSNQKDRIIHGYQGSVPVTGIIRADKLDDMTVCFFGGDEGACGISPSIGEVWDIRVSKADDGSYDMILLGASSLLFTVAQAREIGKNAHARQTAKAKQ